MRTATALVVGYTVILFEIVMEKKIIEKKTMDDDRRERSAYIK